MVDGFSCIKTYKILKIEITIITYSFQIIHGNIIYIIWCLIPYLISCCNCFIRWDLNPSNCLLTLCAIFLPSQTFSLMYRNWIPQTFWVGSCLSWFQFDKALVRTVFLVSQALMHEILQYFDDGWLRGLYSYIEL